MPFIQLSFNAERKGKETELMSRSFRGRKKA
jgi:hypothetical protein